MRELPWISAKSSRQSADAKNSPRPSGDAHLDLARESLRELVADTRIPEDVRESLADGYEQVETMLDKLEQGHIHVAVFGRVSVGKSATINALLGERLFSTSPLHGETKETAMGQWSEYDAGGVFLIDTPGLDEVSGEERERLAYDVAHRSDLVLFVVDSDLTETEIRAMRVLTREQRPIILVLNKIDRYTADERKQLMRALRMHTRGLVEPRDIVQIAADPAERIRILIDEAGNEEEQSERPAPDLADLKQRLWRLLETEGKTLAALNATLFAGNLSDRVGESILKARREVGQRVIRTYCIAKGVAVALNPIAVADLFAAAALDVGLVVHLSKIYGLPLSRREAGELVKTIATHLTLLMGTVWAMNFISSALKLGTSGFSTLVTGTAQGAVAYYSTYVVGAVAEDYLARGKSWGDHGPKAAIRDILDELDRDSILAQARAEIASRVRSAT